MQYIVIIIITQILVRSECNKIKEINFEIHEYEPTTERNRKFYL